MAKPRVYDCYTDMLSKMANLNRYNGSPKLHTQSVAEHSYNVAIFASLFSKINNFPDSLRLAVLEAALSHDMAESVLSDIHYEAKKMIEEFADSKISVLEEKVMSTKFSYFHKDFCKSEGTFHKEGGLTVTAELVSLVCKYCDILDVLMYLDIEENLGNNFHIRRVDVVKRFAICKEQIRAIDSSLKFIEEV